MANKQLFIEPTDNVGRIYLPDNTSSKNPNQRILIDLDQGNFPSGTTYSVDIEDSSKYEVDNSGTVRIKSEVVLIILYLKIF